MVNGCMLLLEKEVCSLLADFVRVSCERPLLHLVSVAVRGETYHWCYKIVKGDLVLQMSKLNDICIQIELQEVG